MFPVASGVGTDITKADFIREHAMYLCSSMLSFGRSFNASSNAT